MFASNHSPFDILQGLAPTFEKNIPSPNCELYPSLEYRGCLEEVLEELAPRYLFHSDSPTRPHIQRLHPARIIRAVVDYKIQHPESPEIENLLKEAIEVALGIYSGSYHAVEAVANLRSRIISSGQEDLLTRPLHQPQDLTTIVASHPSRSKKTARQLATSEKESIEVLFIALAHGGVGVGMDVYLRYCADAGSRDSRFYVARLSTDKLKDTEPRLSPTEVEYLKRLSTGRQVVIFDEDKASGDTLRIARDYFGNIFPSQRVIALTNLDLREELFKIGLGIKPNLFNNLYSKPATQHSQIKQVYEELIKEIGGTRGIYNFNKQGDTIGKPPIYSIMPYDNGLSLLIPPMLEKKAQDSLPDYQISFPKY